MTPSHILVPVDRSSCAETAVDCAAALAEQLDVPITLLHAWEPLYELGVVMGAATIATGEGDIPLAQHIAEEARKTLEHHQRRLAERQLTVHARLAEGPTKQVIEDAIATSEFDLIVMGTHGRTGLSHVMMGSVAEWVVRTSTIPVITIRPDPDGAEGAAGDGPT